MTQPVWCFQCDRVCDAEVIIDADRIENYINHLQRSGITDDMRESAEILEKSAEEQFEERLDQAMTRLEWRRRRESPPKCLECGFTNFLELIPDPNERLESFVHPKCGGTFQYVTSTHASPRSEDILDTEGRKLERRDW